MNDAECEDDEYWLIKGGRVLRLSAFLGRCGLAMLRPGPSYCWGIGSLVAVGEWFCDCGDLLLRDCFRPLVEELSSLKYWPANQFGCLECCQSYE